MRSAATPMRCPTPPFRDPHQNTARSRHILIRKKAIFLFHLLAPSSNPALPNKAKGKALACRGASNRLRRLPENTQICPLPSESRAGKQHPPPLTAHGSLPTFGDGRDRIRAPILHRWRLKDSATVENGTLWRQW